MLGFGAKRSGTQRSIAAVLAVSLSGASLIAGSSAATAARSNGFSYEVVNGGAVITGCASTTIPSCPANLTIPYSLGTHTVTALGPGAFQNQRLQKVTFPTASQIKEIGVNAFAGALQGGGNTLGSVVIPASVETIGDLAFQYSGITNLTFAPGSKLETIGREAFENNDVTSVSIPASVINIEQAAFRDNDLTELAFAPGSSLQAVGDVAFAYNDLKSLVVPASVTSLGDSTFNSNELESVQFEPGTQLSKLDASVFQENELTQVTIPASVTEIESGAFADNDLTTVNFSPSSKLTTIGEGAFYDNKLSSFVVPVDVNSVSDGAFYKNPNLGDVRFLGDKPSFGTSVGPFEDTGSGPIFFSLARTGWINGEYMSGRKLTGVPEPVITSHPQGVKATVGKSATVSVSADRSPSGQGDLLYQWYKGSAAISGATNSTYTTNVAGAYKVRVSSWAGSSLSNSVDVTFVKKGQSAKVKLPTTLKRNKTYRLPATTSAEVKLSWKFKGSGKCKIDKKKATIRCRAATGKRYVTLTGMAKATGLYVPYTVTIKRRVK